MIAIVEVQLLTVGDRIKRWEPSLDDLYRKSRTQWRADAVGNKKLSALTMPWCTYTDPEIAHVGLYEKEAEQKGIPVATFTKKFSSVDRALADGEEEGFVKIHVRKGSDKILGATVVARHAGEMMNEITLAIVKGVGLGSLSGVIHPYPTQAEAIRQLGDAYNATLLTPAAKKLFGVWLRLTR